MEEKGVEKTMRKERIKRRNWEAGYELQACEINCLVRTIVSLTPIESELGCLVVFVDPRARDKQVPDGSQSTEYNGRGTSSRDAGS